MEAQTNSKPLIHRLDEKSSQSFFTYTRFIILLIVILLLGVLTGFGISAATKYKTYTPSVEGISKTKPKQVVGLANKEMFKDKAEGILRKGGIEGEGNFHLERPGGPSRNVYITSTTLDLSEFLGKRIRVWGETFKGQKAGWLMDAGYVEILQ